MSWNAFGMSERLLGQEATPKKSLFSSRWLVLLAMAAVLGVYWLVISTTLNRYGGNWSGFAVIGDRFPAPDIYGPDTLILPKSFGYDGQFFLLAANDPFLRGEAHKYMDVAAYRYQRIMYPWLARLMAGGDHQKIPRALVLINLLAVVAGTMFVGLLCARNGASPLWSLFYGCLSGLLIAMLRDLAEPVAMAFLAGGFWLYDARRYWLCTLIMAAALLSKEICAIALLAMALHALSRQRWQAVIALILAGLPLALWWAYIYHRLGVLPMQGGESNFGMPFVGMWTYATSLFPLSLDNFQNVLGLGFVIFTGLSMLLALVEILRGWSAQGLAFFLYALFFSLMTDKVWVEPWSYGRVLLPLFLLMVVSFAQNKSRLYWLPLWGNLGLFIITLIWLRLI
jgi:hypothetical protein